MNLQQGILNMFQFKVLRMFHTFTLSSNRTACLPIRATSAMSRQQMSRDWPRESRQAQSDCSHSSPFTDPSITMCGAKFHSPDSLGGHASEKVGPRNSPLMSPSNSSPSAFNAESCLLCVRRCSHHERCDSPESNSLYRPDKERVLGLRMMRRNFSEFVTKQRRSSQESKRQFF